jgi:sterol desaturase/sphingolipid hydroxylase (fatty acid hydroxylase superfamily)
MTMLPALFDLVLAVAISGLLISVGHVIERLWPADPEQSAAAVRFDLKYGFVNLAASWFFAPVAGAIAIYLINQAGGGYIQLRADGVWFFLSLAVYLLSKDMLEYFWHRAQHHFPVLWAMHSLHHSEEAFNVSTGWRHFWLEGALRVAVVFPILGIIFKTPTAVIDVAMAIYILNHAWAHMNIRSSLGRWSLWVMNPQYHRLHHSVQPEHWNRNFADLFPFFDVIFGTAYRPKTGEFPATGLVPHNSPQRIVDAVFWPWRRSGSTQVSDNPGNAPSLAPPSRLN